MPLPLWLYCCCGGEPTTCCDWWENCPIATPTNIYIQSRYELVRYYSNGQRLVLADEIWSVDSANAISRKGLNCLDPSGYDDGCTQATYTYESNTYTYAWNVLNDATLDGTTGTISGAGAACSGCIFTGCGNQPYCQKNLIACLSRTDKVSGTVLLAGATTSPVTCQFGRSDSDILKYGCTVDCSGCTSPFIQFRPSTTTFTGTSSTIIGCCNDDTAPDPTPIVIGIPQFTIIGRCGCVDGNTWSDPRGGCTSNPVFEYCTYPIGMCTPINGDVTITTGTDCFSWTCYNSCPDPLFPLVTVCEPCVDYTEVCEYNLTVTVI